MDIDGLISVHWESVGCWKTSEQDLTKDGWAIRRDGTVGCEAIAVMELLDDEDAMRSYLQRCERDRSHFWCPSMGRRVRVEGGADWWIDYDKNHPQNIKNSKAKWGLFHIFIYSIQIEICLVPFSLGTQMQMICGYLRWGTRGTCRWWSSMCTCCTQSCGSRWRMRWAHVGTHGPTFPWFMFFLYLFLLYYHISISISYINMSYSQNLG